MKRFLLLFVFLWARILLFGQGINADFSYDKTIGCGPLTVSFQDLSTGPNPITVWLWNFGDGDTSSLQNPVHIYTKKGSFRVSLAVWDNMGNKAIKDNYYFPQIVSVQPSLNIGNEYLLCNIYAGPPSVMITNKGAGPYGDTFGTYRWSTGDTTANIWVSTPGTYSVTYEACGQTLQDNANVSLTTAKTQVMVDPAATYWDYGFYKRMLNVNIPYSRQAIDRFFIDWKDGKIDTITNPDAILNGTKFIHHYTKPGSYQAIFTTRLKEDDRGYCDTLQSTLVYVRASAVTLELGNDTTIFRGDTLILDAGNPGARYIWREGTTQTIKVTKSGKYSVTVIKDGDLAQDSIWVSVIEGPPSVRARMGIMARSCNTVYFADSSFVSNGQANQWYWVFGDGTTDTVQNPVHTYPANEPYTVKLYVSANNGHTDSTIRTLVPIEIPPVNLGPDAMLARGDTITLTQYSSGKPQYLWSTGDTTKTIKVATPGTYWLRMSYCIGSAADTINILADTTPVYSLKAHINLKQVNCSNVQFIDSSIVTGASIVNRLWTFGDGYSDVKQNPVHAYTQGGYYDVRLVVTDSKNQRDTAYTSVFSNIPLVELGPDTTVKHGPVTLGPVNGIDIRDTANKYLWSTGETTKTITVSAGGTYWLRLTYDTCFVTASDTIRVQAASSSTQPQAHFITNHYCGVIFFEDKSTAPGAALTKWYWDFGDGGTDTLQHPIHTYNNNGSFNVQLIIINNLGESDTAHQIIFIDRIPIARLGADTTLHPGDSIVLGTANSMAPGMRYSWSTGEITRTINVTQIGTYWVEIMNPDQCDALVSKDTIVVTAQDTVIANNPTAQFTADKEQCTTVRFTDQSTTAAGTTITSRQWSFGDNTTDTAQNPLHTYSQRGEYTVSLVVVNSTGKRDTATTKLYFAPLLVDLGADTTLAAAGDSLLLDARKPNNSGDAYLWSTGSTQPVIVVYTSGSYWVKVTTCGTTVTDTITVTIPAVPPASSGLQAGFGFLQTGCRTYRFTDTSKITTGSINHWAWQFGDNTTDTLPNPVHTYSQPGDYIVTLVVTDNSGKQDTAIKLIVNTAIAVNLGQDIDTLRPGGSIRLSAPYPAGSHYSFHWSTGDTTAAITITQPGTYALRVTDRWCGTSAADTINISFVNPVGINAAIGIQGRNCTSVYFLDESTALQPIVKWEWSFGDGTTDTTQSPQHLYAADGQYLVTLVVTDSQGATDTATHFVELINKPNLELGADIILYPGNTVMLGADYPNTTRTWSTGETNPVIAITTPGTYSVTVYYCNGSVSDTIHVYADSIPAKLEAKFFADKLQCTTVKFTNQSTTNAGTSIISRQWSFGDNTTDTAQSPVHTYSQRGTYTVSLLIVNSAGGRDTAFTTIYFAPVLVNLGADTTLAAGSSLLLDARKPNNSGDTYLWSTGANTPTITVTQAGTYWVKVTTCNNTVVSDTIRITQAAEPENPASVGNTTTVNANDSLAVTASFDHSFNSNNIFTIQLLQGDNTGGKKAGELDGTVTNLATIPGTDPRISVKVSIPDTIPCGQDYRVRIVSSFPADTTDWSSKFAVVNMPVATLQQRGDSLFAGKALTYQWYFNGAALTGATTAVIRAKANGQYYVIVSNGGTCRSTSTTVNMVITAVPDVTVGENVVRAFPNPTAGLVYVRFEKPLLKPVDLIVHDTKGNTLYRKQVKDQLTEIDLGTLPKGIYYLEVAGYGKQKAMRIILQ
ncbi:Por secretion system C-terminal sorting domain-containing protein [Chitinophaga rupis]|uniref:Por secretion system C-terminal sorting domain-containing protein n=1 Tax=Chitinophaga rupis TaxID=573321 RepID=A0A1H7VQF3_9BACT|nr:PKD domain-containing protein [Chitinophaga rupis]SEM11045.1 Por secretion system C-terminal sorting domain-containing protein [Chitinophaga rupis]